MFGVEVPEFTDSEAGGVEELDDGAVAEVDLGIFAGVGGAESLEFFLGDAGDVAGIVFYQFDFVWGEYVFA